MLQKVAHEFHDTQGHGSPPATSRFFVPENHVAVFKVNDTAIGNGDLEYIGGEVSNTVVANVQAANEAISQPSKQAFILSRAFVIRNAWFGFQ